jgi:ketopantoate reductase
MSSPPRILIVGAGAVGQVYGWHVHQAGARVSYYVRERYVEECSKGFDLFEIGLFRPTSRATPHHFKADGLLTTPEEVAAHTWDQVWLTIPSNGLRGAWLAPFMEAIGESTLICLQPGPTDREVLIKHIPAHRIVQGMIAFIAYQGPLPEEHLPQGHSKGLIFWHPPMSASPFGGEEVEQTRLQDTLALLKQGKCPVTHQRDVAAKAAFPTTMLMPFLMALEMEQWTLAKLARSPWLSLAAEATEEARDIMARKNNAKPPAALALYAPWTARIALRAAPSFSPLPLQSYLRYHFTKVGEQTRQTMSTYIELGAQLDLPTTHLQHLHDAYHDALTPKEP